MANSITGVGVRYYVPDLESFFKDGLHKGDIVYAMPDFENHHDLEHSIALFHHNNICAHVEGGKTGLIQKKFVNKEGETLKENLAFRYRGSHNVELGTFNLSLDKIIDPEPFQIEGKTYNDFNTTAIYFDKAPYVMNEERELYFLAHAIMKDAEDIMFRDADSPVTAALTDELQGLLGKYEPVACSSLSKDCKQYLDYIIQQIESICQISDILEEKFSSYFDRLTTLKAKMRKKLLQEDIYKTQLKKVTEVLRNGDFFNKFGFYAFKERQNNPDINAIDEETKKVINWMFSLPSGIGMFFEKDEAAFAKGLYDIELHFMDLYLVYAHIAILKYCDGLHAQWREKGPFEPVQAQVINNIIQSLNIADKQEK